VYLKGRNGMSRMAVIVLDMLNDFVTGDLKTARAATIVEPIKKLVESARNHGVPVIYSNDAHLNVDFEVVERWGDHAIKGTKGAQVVPELAPAERDFVVEKRVYSGFYETGLDSLLRSLYKGLGVETVILVGLHTHICVRHTAASAFYRGYKIVVPRDGVEAFTRKEQIEGLKYLKDVYSAETTTVDEIVKEFEDA
jgi:nicotinamidase-related amidase